MCDRPLLRGYIPRPRPLPTAAHSPAPPILGPGHRLSGLATRTPAILMIILPTSYAAGPHSWSFITLGSAHSRYRLSPAGSSHRRPTSDLGLVSTFRRDHTFLWFSLALFFSTLFFLSCATSDRATAWSPVGLPAGAGWVFLPCLAAPLGWRFGLVSWYRVPHQPLFRFR